MRLFDLIKTIKDNDEALCIVVNFITCYLADEDLAELKKELSMYAKSSTLD